MDIYIVRKKLTVGPHKGKECFTLSRGPRRNLPTGNLLEEIENATTLSFADGEMMLRTLVEVVTEKISQGYFIIDYLFYSFKVQKYSFILNQIH